MKKNNFLIIIFLIELMKSQSEQYEDEKCKSIQPFEDAIEDCTSYKIINSNKVCCYMEIVYEEGDLYLCYPIEKNKNLIIKEIEALQDIYEESESINIDCKSSFIELSFIFISCLIIFIFII